MEQAMPMHQIEGESFVKAARASNAVFTACVLATVLLRLSEVSTHHTNRSFSSIPNNATPCKSWQPCNCRCDIATYHVRPGPVSGSSCSNASFLPPCFDPTGRHAVTWPLVGPESCIFIKGLSDRRALETADGVVKLCCGHKATLGWN